MSDDPLERCLVAALTDARATAHPRTAVEGSVGPPPESPWNLLAVGKASLSMALGLADAWPGARCQRGLLVTTHALAPAARRSFSQLPLEVLEASHPLPDEASVAAGTRALALAAQDQPLVVLLSGGASSMLAGLAPGIALPEKRAVIDALLRSGESIRNINAIRRRLSPVKGGGLLVGRNSPTTTWIVSDIVGGDAHEVGSGPSTPDPTPSEVPLALATALGLPHHALVTSILSSAPQTDLGPSTSIIVLSPQDMAVAMACACAERGIATAIEPADDGPLDEVVRCRVRRAEQLSRGEAVVWATEPSVAVPLGAGRGGRAGRAAILIARELPDDYLTLCAATDGVDGTAGTAGAIVDSRLLRAVDPSKVEAALCTYDDASLHKRLGTALHLPLDATNLTDLHLVVRRP